MDKFLNICFKIGKAILFIFLVFCLIVTISTICILPKTFKNIELVTPTFYEILNNSESIKNIDNTDKKYVEPYKIEFDKIKTLFSDYGQRMFLAQVNLIDDEYKVLYVKGAGVALNASLEYCKTMNLSERKCSELFAETANNYHSYFKRNITQKQVSELKQKAERIAVFAALGSSILLFILFLAIALLVKIEENTRK